MISKLLNYHRKIGKVVTKVALTEIVQMVIYSFVFTMVMLMITHLLIAGEFGFCYWRLKGGWIWENYI